MRRNYFFSRNRDALLEPCDGKLSRTVLRGESPRKGADLLDLKKMQVYYTDRNSYRVPDYFRMDLSFNIEPSHHLTLLTHSSLSFGIYNLTGRKNVYSVYFVSEEGRIQGYKMSIFGAPIPFVTYNIKF